MNVTFVSRHYELKDSQKSYVERKLKSIRERYFDKRLDVQVELTSEKSRYRCELNVRSDKFKELLRSESHDMQQSIVEAIDKLEMMLRKQHDKSAKRKRIEKPDLAESVMDLPSESEGNAGNLDDSVELPEIVEVASTPTKLMSVPAAAVLLQESEDQFIAFRDAQENEIAILYKRRDGKLGLMRPSP